MTCGAGGGVGIIAGRRALRGPAAATLRYRAHLPQFVIPIGSADDDNWLVTFEHGPRDGQVWINVGEEVSVRMDEPWNPEEGAYPVAGSFTAFVKMLQTRARD